MTTLKFNDLNKVLDWIREPSHKEHLYILEAAIAKANQVSLDQFSVGAKVVFGRPKGAKHHGVIVKCNPKKAVVMEEGRGKWTVPYSLIKLEAA
tara:strand:+ start:294 stop:575 length:282 start_codon:yes stop_codon:yes gene_type:complete